MQQQTPCEIITLQGLPRIFGSMKRAKESEKQKISQPVMPTPRSLRTVSLAAVCLSSVIAGRTLPQLNASNQ